MGKASKLREQRRAARRVAQAHAEPSVIERTVTAPVEVADAPVTDVSVTIADAVADPATLVEPASGEISATPARPGRHWLRRAKRNKANAAEQQRVMAQYGGDTLCEICHHRIGDEVPVRVIVGGFLSAEFCPDCWTLMTKQIPRVRKARERALQERSATEIWTPEEGGDQGKHVLTLDQVVDGRRKLPRGHIRNLGPTQRDLERLDAALAEK